MILLINILILCCIILSLITYIFATVKYEIGKQDENRCNKKLFKDYYSNLTQNEKMKTVLEDNEVLARELCHTLGSAFGEHLYEDPGNKKCFIRFIEKEVQIEDSKLVWIKLERCRCVGRRPLRVFYIREYTVNDDISVYFVIDSTDWYFNVQSNDKYYAVTFMFDAAHKILFKDFFPLTKQESKLTPPSPEDQKKNEIQNKNLPPGDQQEGNQSEITNVS